MPDKQTPLAPGQRWVPTREGSRAKARVIERVFEIVDYGGKKQMVDWFHSCISASAFRAWIARHEAVLQEGE